MSIVVTFGELLMRLSPQGVDRIIQTSLFQSRFTGAEANVAISLAFYGDSVRFVSRLPNNILGEAAENAIRHFGVDTSYCKRGGDRLGLFFTEKGTSQRASTVLYDRTGSSFSQSRLEDYDWERIFQGCEWFHFSGIDLILNEQLFLICKKACDVAKRTNVKVCFDVNFRSSLSDKTKAIERIKQIMPYVDLLVGNERELAMLAGREIALIDLSDFDKYIDYCYKSAVSVQEHFSTKIIAMSLRRIRSASETAWSGMIVSDTDLYVSTRFEIKVTEVIGCGDAFVAGLLHSFMRGKTASEALDFAVAASCLKHTIEGDYNLVKEFEVEQLMHNYAYGIVQR